MGAYSSKEEDADDLAIARELVSDGWKQTSSRLHRIARLPPGKTGLQALEDIAPHAYRRIMDLAEQNAANEYRRVYADLGDDTARTLDSGMWIAFKKAGGEASF